MDEKEKRLSDYIDKLNREEKPEEHEIETDSPELEALFATVRQVRSIKEPVWPEGDYQQKLSKRVGEIVAPGRSKSIKRGWFAGAATLAAVLILVIVLNFAGAFGKENIVYAMENAFGGIKAYHGVLSIVENNEAGEKLLQGKLEIWADKEGRYVVKALEGSQKGLITANNGEKKWQLEPNSRQATLFPAFPDSYPFLFELGTEIENVKNAVNTKTLGEEWIAGRKATVLEVTPKGGSPYKLWIDQETKLPLQKQSAMENALQYIVSFENITFEEVIPMELLTYKLPEGYEEKEAAVEQLVTNYAEAAELVGFEARVPEKVPVGYVMNSIAVEWKSRTIKQTFTMESRQKTVLILQKTAVEELKPAATAMLGKINGYTAEIQSPIQASQGILSAGAYSGMTNLSSIRWQEAGLEYAVVGNASLEELKSFAEGLTRGTVELPEDTAAGRPQVEVPVNMEQEANEQKSVDAGHSPWKLDPVFVAQVFVSLKLSPEGIVGDYPIKEEDLKLTQSSSKEAVVEISGEKTPIRRVYLKRLVREDATGIWTVVGYDPVE